MDIKINTELGILNLLFLIFLFVIIVFILYRTVFLKNNKSIFFIDFFSAILLLSILLQIEIDIKIKKREKGNLIVMIDNSLSMSTIENGKTRLDIIKEILRNYSRMLKKYKPIFYIFGSSLKKIEEKDIEKLKAHEEETNILKNIFKVKEINKNKRISGILLLSDGIETSFPINENLKDIDIPVYTILPLKTSLKDISIDRVIAPQYVYKGEKNKIDIYLKSSNLKNSAIKINLKKNNKIMESKIIEGKEENLKVVFEFIPESQGYEIYEIEVIPPEKEVNIENNKKSIAVMSILPLIKVLYIEGYLRWEYKFLKNFLEENPNIEPVCMISIGKHIYQQTGGKEFNFQGNLFEKKSDFGNFHIIISGDIDFSGFNTTQMKNIKEIVENGTNIIFLGGKNFLKGIKNSPLENIVPVKIEGNENKLIEEDFIPILTEPGKNLSIFEEPTNFPYLFTINNIKYIADDSIPVLIKKDGRILMAYKVCEKGTSLIIATDSLWRWYISGYRDIFETFFNRIIRFLMPPEKYLKLKTETPEFKIEKNIYKTGEIIEVEPLFENNEIKEKTNFNLITPEGKKEILKQEEGKIKFKPEKEGVYIIEGVNGQYKNFIPIYVNSKGIELLNCIPDYQYLKNISEFTGGKFIPLEEITNLEKYIPQTVKSENMNFKITKENRKLFILILYITLNFSWFLRRKKGII
jgi:hypothetical protein